MTAARMRLSDLVEDEAVYPRGSVSLIRVDDYAYALDAGAQFPPPVIDEATRKIVDGFHRTRAMRKRWGDDAEIDVDVQAFADDAEMLATSARLNNPQGLPLSRLDQRVFYIRAKALGMSDEEAASALGVTVDRVIKVAVMTAQGDDGPVALKQPMGHLGGNYLTQEQVAAIKSARAAPARAKVAEMTRLLRLELLPLKLSPALRTELAELATVIGEALAPFGE